MSAERKLQGNRKKESRKDAKPQESKTTIISFRESDIFQRWLVTTEGCPTCAEIKKDFKQEFKSGKIKAVDVGSDKGFEIVAGLGLSEVPVFVVELKPGHSSGVKYLIDE